MFYVPISSENETISFPEPSGCGLWGARLGTRLSMYVNKAVVVVAV